MTRVERDGALGLVADDAGAPDALLLPHGERGAAHGGGQGEVAVGAERVGRDGAAGQPLGAGVERVALGTLHAVGDLLALVEQGDGRAPVGLVGRSNQSARAAS